MDRLLTPPQIEQSLAVLEGWEREDPSIVFQLEFATFPVAIAFVQAVAEVAEAMDHHPDIDIRHRRVRIALATHSAEGLTDLDFALAVRCDEVAGSVR